MTVDADQNPALTLDKTSDVATYDEVGDLITYTYVATNTGNVTLNNVTISDPLPGLSALSACRRSPATLAPTAAMNCSATYTITQADLDSGSVVNTATADSDETDPVDDTVTVDADQNPALTLDKTSDVATYDEVGDLITYTYVATNTGNVTLNNVTISDPLPGLSALSCVPTQPGTLAPTAAMNCSATYTITQADLDSGSVVNTATADSDETDPVDDTVTVDADQNPALTLDKTSDVATYDEVGDLITYTYVATNTGNVTLNNVTISDPLPGLSALSCVPTQPGTLAPTAAMNCSATYTITQADLDSGSVVNTATADSDETDPVDDTVTVDADQNPALTLDKTSDVATYDEVGDLITYTYVATNTGNVTLNNVTISDPLPGLSALSCVPTQPGTLAPTAAMNCSATYTITQADLDSGSVVNTATADSDETDPVDDTVTVDADQNPALTLDKTSDVATYDEVGDLITYTYVATNTGNVTLNNVTISDPLPGLSALSCVPTQPGTLAPTAAMNCSATYTITQADLDSGSVVNTATADSDETDPVDDTVTVDADQNPALTLDKTSDVATYDEVGDLITYTYVATNTGNVTLNNVTISDPLPGLSALSCVPTQPGTLAPTAAMNCSATYTITQADLDSGSVVNTATADSDETDPVDDTVTVDADQNPALTLDKTSDVATYDEVGDLITYTYVATNTGNVTLNNVTISDPLPGLSALSCVPTQPGTLAPTAAMNCSATYTITQADLDSGSVVNTATADSDETDPVDDTVTVDADQNPALTLDKTSDVATYDEVGDLITYTYVATNTGNVTLNNVTISDPLPGLSALSCVPTQPGTLAPTAAMNCSATYTITQADLDSGSVVNTATADSDETDPVDDTVTVDADQNPAIDIEKSTNGDDADAAPGPYIAVGDPVNWGYVVTNTGNVTLSPVTVADHQLGDICTIETLAVGETQTCSAIGVATPGQYANLGTAAGTDPNGDPVSDDDPSHYFGAAPDFAVAKDCSSEPIPQAGPADYQVTFINNGNVTLRITADDGIGTFDLDVGESATYAVSLPGPFIGQATADNTVAATSNYGYSDGSSIEIVRSDDASCWVAGEAEIIKLTQGLANDDDGTNPEWRNWTFTLYDCGVDPCTKDSPVLGTITSPPSQVTFDANLVPFQLDPDHRYRLCEVLIPPAWTNTWMGDIDDDGTPETIIPFVPATPDPEVGVPPGWSGVFDPLYAPPPAEWTNDERCVNFVADAGMTEVFEIDNQFPGGEPRTIGYWKNWDSCSGGGQVATAIENGGDTPDDRLYSGNAILDDVLQDPGITIGLLTLIADDDVFACDEGTQNAVYLLDKRDLTKKNKKRAADAAYGLASQLLAAIANDTAGAWVCDEAGQAAIDGQTLLFEIGFDGTRAFYDKKVDEIEGHTKQEANTLAGILDSYNNGTLCVEE